MSTLSEERTERLLQAAIGELVKLCPPGHEVWTRLHMAQYERPRPGPYDKVATIYHEIDGVQYEFHVPYEIDKGERRTRDCDGYPAHAIAHVEYATISEPHPYSAILINRFRQEAIQDQNLMTIIERMCMDHADPEGGHV